MKFTLGWLKTHLDTDADIATLARAMTDLGLEVEEVDDPSQVYGPFKVAHVVKAEPHPDADRLRVCQVDTGTGVVQVVCGAPNARTGMKGVFAPAGSHVPGTGLDLKKGKIRGVESNGMLVSEREMGLSDDHEGIIDLPEDTPIGTPFAEVAGLDDPIFHLGITPERADCLGVRGVARDLAAAGLGALRPLDLRPVAGVFDNPIALDITDTDACPLFAARLIRGVRNGPSPKWLQDRLRAIGLRPISALVDITNFVTFDLARPLHVFDAGRLTGNRLTIHPAAGGEELAALNDKTYVLDPGMTVISDGAGVQSLAGVIGGAATGCTEATVDVVLESALFDPVRTAITGRRLQIISDARFRFERGVDPAFVLPGAEIATRLILELCGGEPSTLTVAGAVPDHRPTITLRPERLADLGGLAVARDEAIGTLECLGFEITDPGSGPITAVAPSWRRDVALEADLVEEVLRVHGYDEIPAVPLPPLTALPTPARTPAQARLSDVKRLLATRGLMETVTWSFMSLEHVDLVGGVPDSLRLANPISTDLDVMRPSILPNLLQAAARNAARGWPDLGLFEVGPRYRDDSPKGQDQICAALRAGRTGPRHWDQAPRDVDVFDAKADALAVLSLLGLPGAQVEAGGPDWYHPGRVGTLKLGPKKILGHFGEIHPRVRAALGVKTVAVGFELNLDEIPLPRAKGKTRPALDASAFQPVTRDFAFVVPAEVAADQVIRAAAGADKALIAEIGVFDLYEGDKVAAGHKSLAIQVTLQPTKATLTDDQIEAVASRIVAEVTKRTGATLRT